MKLQSLILTAAISLFTMTGCNLGTNPQQNETTPQTANATAGSITKSFEDFSAASIEPFSTITAERALGDTIVITVNGVSWKYIEALQAWIRMAKLTIGIDSMVCTDTIKFFDANNAAMKVPTLAATVKMNHTRSVVGSSLTVPYNYQYAMTVTITKSTSDTFFIFNGSLVGTYNKQNINTTVIKDVKRKLMHTILLKPYLGFPVSGTIDVDIPEYTILVVYGGTNTAQVTITRKSDGKTWIVNINITVTL